MSGVSQLLVYGVLGFGVSYGVIVMMLSVARRLKTVRRPDEMHHSHRTPVSRLGGAGLVAAFAVVSVLAGAFNKLNSGENWCIIGSSLAMFGLGLWDDLRALGARRKLFGQAVIASFAFFLGIAIDHFKIPFTGYIIDLGLWSWLATVIWLVGMTNLINLIDGVDGLAGGICLMLMLLMAVVGGISGTVSFTAVGMAGALLAFLRFNFPPARIFMGDGGAYFLGYLIGVLTIISSHKGTVVAAMIAPLFVLALPILDTSLAVLRRGVQGLPLFRADRRHIHHRLLDSGLSRRTIVLGAYAFTAFFLGLGFVAFWWRGQYFALVLGIGVVAVLLAAGRLNFSREWFAVGRVLGNSLNARAEIQYGLAQARWLAMEGVRCKNIGDLCEDLAFITRKLGFASVTIRLEDGEKNWQIFAVEEKNSRRFQHKLPGHPYCFVIFVAPWHHLDSDQDLSEDNPRAITVSTFKILSEVLAEGWAKAISAFEKHQQLPVRFDSKPPSAAESQTPKVHTAT